MKSTKVFCAFPTTATRLQSLPASDIQFMSTRMLAWMLGIRDFYETN